MLKLGISNTHQDTQVHRLWRRGTLSASLLAVSNPPTASEVRRFDRLMPHITLSSGVTRTTFRNRMASLDEVVRKRLLDVFPAGSDITVEDWAVSSGITAFEWFNNLHEDYPTLRFAASDSMLHLVEARHLSTGETYILEPDGTPIQYIRPPFVINLILQSHKVYPVNRWLRKHALANWRDRFAGQCRLPQELRTWPTIGADLVVGPFAFRALPLLHPEVLQLGASDDSFEIRRHSVFSSLDKPVNVIRTMNILNLAYFPEKQLREAVAAIQKSLKPGGLWVVGRTRDDNPVHQATIYRKRESERFERLDRTGDGSEIEHLVTVT